MNRIFFIVCRRNCILQQNYPVAMSRQSVRWLHLSLMLFCYEWSYPFVCIHAVPQYPKYAEKLTHRDVLGALMHLWAGPE